MVDIHHLRLRVACKRSLLPQVEPGRSAACQVARKQVEERRSIVFEGDELRALRQLRREHPDSAFVFNLQRQVHSIIARADSSKEG